MMNGESPWISINEVIYFGEVDEGDIVLQNMNGGNWLDFSKIIYTTASGYVILFLNHGVWADIVEGRSGVGRTLELSLEVS
jgi:hypothetical protein